MTAKPDSIRIEIRTGDNLRVIEITELIGGCRLDINGGGTEDSYTPDHYMVSLVALGKTSDMTRPRP